MVPAGKQSPRLPVRPDKMPPHMNWLPFVSAHSSAARWSAGMEVSNRV